MKWDYHDIRYIRKDLREKGLAQGILLDELVDHVCCEVELEMESGLPFKKAYEKVLKATTEKQLGQLREESFYAINYNTRLMLNNIFKIMWRNALKYRLHTFISLIGLAIGLMCFLVIALFVKHELSFDTQFSKSESIYRVTMSSTVGGNTNTIPTSYAPIGPELKARFGEVAEYTRIINYKYTRQQPTFRSGEKVFYEDGVIFADSTFFSLFDFPFVAGNAATALNEPNAVVLTQQMAEKYFGEKNALGKALRFNDTEMTVTGVLENLPSNTHLQFDFVIPMTGLAFSGVFGSTGSGVLESYQVDWFWDYLYIPDGSAIEKIEAGVNALAEEKTPDTFKAYNLKFYLQALEDVHLLSEFDYNTDISENGDRKNLFILASIGMLVLIISSINFINIAMAAATRRYKEVGISKVLGAMRAQLRFQFLLEAVVTCIAALVVAVAGTLVALPIFSEMLGVPISLSLMQDQWILIAVLLFAVFIGIVSGAYPAFFVSSFEPQRVLKGVWKPGVGGAAFRKVLIGVQVAISIFLIIGTIVVSEQLRYINNRPLGFDKEHVVMLPIRGTQLSRGGYTTFKNTLLNETAIASVTSVSEPIGREVQFMSFKIEGREEDQFVKILNVTHDFVSTMGLELVAGRDFSPDIASDSMSGFIINEAAAKAFGWDDPIGKAINHTWNKGADGRVIGVVKDFNFEPLQKQIDPIIIWFGRPFWYAAVKVEQGRNREALVAMEKSWKLLEPEKPFAFHFLDESIQHVYDKEQRMSRLFYVFSILSIITAMLGLYGLVTFILEQRLMEIGVRKVMGASVSNIIQLISKEYLILVIASFVVAVPVTYGIMNQWLQGFAYRIGWSAWYFVVGLIVSLGVVLITVISKAVATAAVNPIKVLRGE
ncbi:MAG: ABC transporter permease [Cyclobacteriaceae bacterium]